MSDRLEILEINDFKLLGNVIKSKQVHFNSDIPVLSMVNCLWIYCAFCIIIFSKVLFHLNFVNDVPPSEYTIFIAGFI